MTFGDSLNVPFGPVIYRLTNDEVVVYKTERVVGQVITPYSETTADVVVTLGGNNVLKPGVTQGTAPGQWYYGTL